MVTPLTLQTHRWRCNVCHSYGDVQGEAIAYLVAEVARAHAQANVDCPGGGLEVWPVIQEPKPCLTASAVSSAAP